jgi:circadian clock protein KaiB
MKGATASPPKSDRAIVLQLYVAGDGPNSLEARDNLQAFLAAAPEVVVKLEVVDVLVHPDRGLDARIVVTPTLVRTRPLPEQRIVGNLRDRIALLAPMIRSTR